MLEMAVNRYIQALALCNDLALLASRGTMTIFIQRVGLLTKLLKGWMKDFDLEVVCNDPDGSHYLEQIDVTASALNKMEIILETQLNPDPSDVNSIGSVLAAVFLQPWQMNDKIISLVEEEDDVESVNQDIIPVPVKNSFNENPQLKRVTTDHLTKAKSRLGITSKYQKTKIQQKKTTPGN